MNWNKTWRYVHLAAGLMLVIYHSRIAYVEYGWIETAWSAEIDKFVSTSFVFLVMWTGLAKWPIYPLYKKRQNRKKKMAKQSAIGPVELFWREASGRIDRHESYTLNSTREYGSIQCSGTFQCMGQGRKRRGDGEGPLRQRNEYN